MVGWHHRLDEHGFGSTLGVGDGQGGLACFGSWGHKELDTTEWLNWTELGSLFVLKSVFTSIEYCNPLPILSEEPMLWCFLKTIFNLWAHLKFIVNTAVIVMRREKNLLWNVFLFLIWNKYRWGNCWLISSRKERISHLLCAKNIARSLWILFLVILKTTW